MNRAAALSCSLLLATLAAIAAAEEPVRSEALPPKLSLYLPIPLGVPNVASQETGVFVPDGYRAGDAVDLVLFLRGYDIQRPRGATAISEYWNSPEHAILKSFQFREEVNRSGKNVIFVAPRLGPYSEAGKLKEPDGPQHFLEQVVEGLWRHGPHAGAAKAPAIRSVILAAHSGGGVPLRQIARLLGDDANYKDKIKECWGFDSIYGVKDKDAEFWSEWAAEHPRCTVAMYYLFTDKEVGKDPKRPIGPDNPADHREPTGTTFPAQELERLAKARMLGNVRVLQETKQTTLNHTEVPRTHLAELLKAAKYLEDR
jgi:hypothetical protein